MYNESYDVEKLAEELTQDEERTLHLWARRLKCAIACRNRRGFSASLTRCLADGVACDYGKEDGQAVDQVGIASEKQSNEASS